MKKFLSLVLVLILSFFLFGCNLISGGGGGIVVPEEVDFDDVFINVASQIENKDNITDNITLPTKFGSVTIQWTSMNENVISSSGVVTRPEEDTRVVLKCDLYANGEHKQYEVNIIVKASEVIITPVEISSIKNIKAGEVGSKYKTQATVVALAKVGAVIQDNTGLIYCYFGSAGTDTLAIGDVIEVEGNTSLYGGAVQFTEGSTYNKVSTASVTQPSATLMSASEFVALKDAPGEISFVKFEGTLNKSGNYYNLALEGIDANILGSLCTPSADLTEFVGKKVEVSGYFVYTITASSGVTYNYVAFTDIKLCEGQEIPPTPPVVTYSTFAEVKASETGKEYNVKDAVVIATTSTGFLAKDSSGYMFIYMGTGYVADVAQGDVLEIKGTSSVYGGAVQLGTATYTKGSAQTVTHPNPRVLDKDSYNALNAESINIEYVQVEATLRASGSYFNLEVEGATITGSLLAPSNNNYSEMVGKKVVVTGYFVYVSGSSTKYINIIPTEVKLSENQGNTEVQLSTVETVIASDLGKTYKVKGQVVAVSAQSALIKDSTGFIYCYFSSEFNKDLAIGDVIEVEGITSSYGGMVQFNRPTYKKIETKDYNPGDPSILDVDAYNAIVDATALSVQYVQVDAKISVSGNYTNFTLEGGKINGSIVYPAENLADFNSKDVTITGYFVGITGSSTKYFNIIATSVVEKESGSGQDTPPTPLTLSTVAEAKALAIGTECIVKGTVVATANTSVLIQDSTGLILVYFGDTYAKDLKVTDEIQVTGKVAAYGGQIQISEPTYEKTGYNEVTYPTPRELDKDAYEALLGADAVIEYVTLTAKLSISGVYTNLEIDGSELTGSLVSPDKDLTGYNVKYVNINAYFVYVTGSSKKYVYFIPTLVTEKQMSNTEKLEEVKQSVLSINNLHTVRSMIFFTEYDEFTVTWVSDNPNIMANDGTLTIPEVTSPVNFTVTITDGSVTEVVAITIYAEAYTNISDIIHANELDFDKMYAVKASVVATANQGFLVKQGDDYIYAYVGRNYAKDLVIGDEVKLSGFVGEYNGIIEFANAVGYQKTGNTNPVSPTFQALTNDEIIALVRQPITTPVKVEGTLVNSGNYFNIIFEEGSNITGSIVANDMDLSELLNKEVVVEGYFIYASGSGAYFNIMATSISAKEGGEDNPPTPLDLSTIAEVKAGEIGQEFKVSATVVAAGRTSILLKDDSGLILLYFTNGSDTAYEVGSIVTVQAKLATYGGQLQLAEPTECVVTGQETVTYPDARVLDKDAYEALLGTDAVIEYVKLQAKLVISGQYYNLEVEGSEIAGSMVAPLADISELNGKTIDLLGYFVYVSGSSKKYIYFIATDIIEVEGQDNPPETLKLSTIAEVKAGEIGQEYKVSATVIAVGSEALLVQDETGIILAYFGNAGYSDVELGDIVTVQGKTSLYGGSIQFNTPSYAVTGQGTVTYPSPRVLDLEAFEALFGEYVNIEYVQLVATLNISGKYYNFTVGDGVLKGSLVAPKNDISELNGKEIIFTAYTVYITGTNTRYLYFFATSIEEVKPSDEEILAELKQSVLDTNNFKTVKSLNFITEYEGFTLTWQSSNEDAITSNGVVTIQESEDAVVPFTVTITNGTLTEVVTINIIVGAYTSISDALEVKGEDLADVHAVKGTVVASADLGFIVYDGAYIYVYYGDTYAKDLQVGDNVSVSGYLYPYQGINEFNRFIGYKKLETTSDVEVSFNNNVDQALVNDLYENPRIMPVTLEGELSLNGNYINVDILGTTMTGSILASDIDVSEFAGKYVSIQGYFVYIAGNNYFNVLPIGIMEKETVTYAVTVNVNQAGCMYYASRDDLSKIYANDRVDFNFYGNTYYLFSYALVNGERVDVDVFALIVDEDITIDVFYVQNTVELEITITNPLNENARLFAVGYSEGSEVFVPATVNGNVASATFDYPHTYYYFAEYILPEEQLLPTMQDEYYSATETIQDSISAYALHVIDEMSFTKSHVANDDGSWTVSLTITLSDKLQNPVFNLTDVKAFGFLNGDFSLEYLEVSILADNQENVTLTQNGRVYTYSIVVPKEIVTKYTSEYYYPSQYYKGTLGLDFYGTLYDGEYNLSLTENHVVSCIYFNSFLDVVETVGSGTIDDPLTAGDANALGQYLPNGVYTNESLYVEGIVEEGFENKYYNIYILDDQGNRFYVYGLLTSDGLYHYGTAFNKVENLNLQAGDKVLLYTQIYHYVSNNGASIFETLDARLIKINDQDISYTLVEINQAEPVHSGTQEDPLDEADCALIASKLDAANKEISQGRYYILATITSDPDSSYCNFNISFGKTNILVYGLSSDADFTNRYGSKREISELPVKNGDKVLLYAYIQNYSGDYELYHAQLIDIISQN